jgi:nitroreductase
MDTFDAIYGRRAVKHFDPDHEISHAEVQKLLEAAIQSPTSFNIQHWRFVVVQDKELRQQIREAGNDQAQMTDASLLIVMTADVQAWNKDPQRYWKNAPAGSCRAARQLDGPLPRGPRRAAARRSAAFDRHGHADDHARRQEHGL